MYRILLKPWIYLRNIDNRFLNGLFYISTVSLFPILILLSDLNSPQKIQNYQSLPVFTPVYINEDKKTLYLAIRTFKNSSGNQFLVVNSQTFEVRQIAAKKVDFRFTDDLKENPAGYVKYNDLLATPYIKHLRQYTSSPYSTVNDGLTHSQSFKNGAFMTVDLCPSINRFEWDFFNRLINQATKLKKPVPIAINISGFWILNHKKELNWLKKQNAKGLLQITWVNHSLRHMYFPDVKDKDNLLLLPETNIDQEILNTEILLLENHIIPSIFFRLPGLISNEKIILKLRSLGLIPVGANAWLAKNEFPEHGSIVLVHGNGNEKAGVVDQAIRLIDKFEWLPLIEALQ